MLDHRRHIRVPHHESAPREPKSMEEDLGGQVTHTAILQVNSPLAHLDAQ